MPVGQSQVIVGASAAGVSAALGMREAGYGGDIVLIDADPNLPYERPPLSKSLAGGSPAGLRPIVPAASYAGNHIDLRLGVAVTALDPANRRVELADGSSLNPDHVILATGLAARRLDVPGAALRNIMTLRDAADSASLTARLALGAPLVIVGAGFIGLELAAVAATAGIDVTVIEIASAPLGPVLGSEVGHLVEKLHRERGVRFILGGTVAGFLGRDEVESVLLDDERRVSASTVVVGVGTIARDQLALRAGIVGDRGIRVDEHGFTNDPWVSAAGDIASQPHPWLDAPSRIEHWDVAMRHGRAVGMSAVGAPTTSDAVPYAWSDQYDLTLQMFGRPSRKDAMVVQSGARPDRFLAFWQREGQLRAVAGMNASRDVRAAKTLIERRLAVPAEVLADAGTDLRTLARKLASTVR